jgi:CRISPR-associated exonuclease Cas4
MEFLLLVLLVLALGAAYYLRQSGRAAQARAGVPINARVVSSDTGAWARLEKPLFSRRYQLTGKPDYIVRDDTGATIPIEVKPTRTTPHPRHSDTMQLMAYGVLIEEKFGTRPAYGLLKYRDEVFEIAFTEELRAEFFETLKEMRAARRAKNVSRNHADAVKCKYCGYRDACEERLA